MRNVCIVGLGHRLSFSRYDSFAQLQKVGSGGAAGHNEENQVEKRENGREWSVSWNVHCEL